MHYFGNPGHTQIWFWLSISGNSCEKLHCGNVVNMPYLNAHPISELCAQFQVHVQTRSLCVRTLSLLTPYSLVSSAAVLRYRELLWGSYPQPALYVPVSYIWYVCFKYLTRVPQNIPRTKGQHNDSINTWLSGSGNFDPKLHCGNDVNMPYWKQTWNQLYIGTNPDLWSAAMHFRTLGLSHLYRL